MSPVPHLIVDGLIAYGAVGGVVAAAFLLIGLDRIDPQAHGSIAFRPLLVPGIVLLWPLVAARWAALVRR